MYVSCEPTTLARDLKYLTKHGYKAVRAVPFDMFPATEHVETCVLAEQPKTRCESKDRCGSGRLLMYEGRTEKE